MGRGRTSLLATAARRAMPTRCRPTDAPTPAGARLTATDAPRRESARARVPKALGPRTDDSGRHLRRAAEFMPHPSPQRHPALDEVGAGWQAPRGWVCQADTHTHTLPLPRLEWRSSSPDGGPSRRVTPFPRPPKSTPRPTNSCGTVHNSNIIYSNKSYLLLSLLLLLLLVLSCL